MHLQFLQLPDTFFQFRFRDFLRNNVCFYHTGRHHPGIHHQNPVDIISKPDIYRLFSLRSRRNRYLDFSKKQIVLCISIFSLMHLHNHIILLIRCRIESAYSRTRQYRISIDDICHIRPVRVCFIYRGNTKRKRADIRQNIIFNLLFSLFHPTHKPQSQCDQLVAVSLHHGCFMKQMSDILLDQRHFAGSACHHHKIHIMDRHFPVFQCSSDDLTDLF